MVAFFIEHEGGYGPASVGMVTGLTTNVDGSSTDTKLVLGAGDSMGRGRHLNGSDVRGR